MNDPNLRLALEDLYAEYARLLDDGPLGEWPELFTGDCLYLVIPRENHEQGLPLAIMRCESRDMLRDRVRAVQETIMHEPRYLRHQITQIRPQAPADDGTIAVTANYSVIEVLQDALPRILSVGRYLDRVVRTPDGALRFAEKRVVYDSEMVPNTIVRPL
ncbi:MAG TPA: aromatic-ring-hydroxylating dioxygenase subunit beta [Pseudomonadales bacterium]